MALENTTIILEHSENIIKNSEKLISILKEAKVAYHERKAELDTSTLKAPTIALSKAPSIAPSKAPSKAPSIAPSKAPSIAPSKAPSIAPSKAPSIAPSKAPSIAPKAPSIAPSKAPSIAPSKAPSKAPSIAPSKAPSKAPSIAPSKAPSIAPSKALSKAPSIAPSKAPSKAPSIAPSKAPSQVISVKSFASKRSKTIRQSSNPQLSAEFEGSICQSNRRLSAPEIQREDLQSKRSSRKYSESLILQEQKMHRSHSADKIDMNIAYGELPPPTAISRVGDVKKWHKKASKILRILDEADCLQHSAATIIEKLKENPNSLASVVHSIIEINNLVNRMTPGDLSLFNISFPDVMAILSNQLFIATAAGLGINFFNLAGSKTIGKIEEEKEEEHEIEDLRPIEESETTDLSSIDIWRRGIADAEAESHGTIVDGEFITKEALRINAAKGGHEDDSKSCITRKSRANSVKSSKTTKTAKTHRTHRSASRLGL